MLYLIEDRDYLKIGYAKSIKQRLSNYITENVYAKLIDYKEGDLIDERSLHLLCHDYKYRGEWFINCDEVKNIWKSYDNNKDRKEFNNLTFKEVVLKYHKTGVLTDFETKKYPWLKEAFEILEIKDFSKLRYVQTEIIKLYKTKSDKSLDYKIAVELNDKIELNKFYKLGEVKRILTNIYENLNINQKAKSNDIEKYYITEPKTKKVNGIPVKGLILLTPLFRVS